MQTSHHLIRPEDLHWRPSNLMKIPNADFLERTGSAQLGARLWRLPPRSANTLHKHVRQEEFFFVVQGTGRIRVDGVTLTVPQHGGLWIGPEPLRQVFNDTDEDVLWLITGAPEELEFLKGSKAQTNLALFYPVEPTQLPPELAGTTWPPREETPATPAPPVPAAAVSASAASPAPDFAAHAREWIAAWNAHDLERILACYADDVEFTSPFVIKLTGKPDGMLRGKTALRDYFARGLSAYPDLRFELLQLYPGVRGAVLVYRSVNGLLAAETMEFDAAGLVRRVHAHYTPEKA